MMSAWLWSALASGIMLAMGLELLPCIPGMVLPPAGVDTAAQPARPREAARAAAMEMFRIFVFMKCPYKRFGNCAEGMVVAQLRLRPADGQFAGRWARGGMGVGNRGAGVASGACPEDEAAFLGWEDRQR